MTAVRYFRPRREGPEAGLEDAVAAFAPQLVESPELAWLGGSLQVGAGFPDLLVAKVDPEARPLPAATHSDSNVLAFLHVAGAGTSVSVDAVARFMRVPRSQVEDRLSVLAAADIIAADQGRYGLFPKWRVILAQVIAIEVKVANWQRAAAQARRNRLFAHASYVALPCRLAHRVCNKSAIRDHQLGVLGIHPDGTVSVVRESQRWSPLLWNYYYWIALKAAETMGELTDAVPSSHGSSSGSVC